MNRVRIHPRFDSKVFRYGLTRLNCQTSDPGPWMLLVSMACTRQYRRAKYTTTPGVTLNVYDGSVKPQSR